MSKVRILVLTDNERAFAIEFGTRVRNTVWKYIYLYDHIRGIDYKKILVMRKIYDPEKANKIQIINADFHGCNLINL